MGGTHFLQTGYLLLNRNAPLFSIPFQVTNLFLHHQSFRSYLHSQSYPPILYQILESKFCFLFCQIFHQNSLINSFQIAISNVYHCVFINFPVSSKSQPIFFSCSFKGRLYQLLFLSQNDEALCAYNLFSLSQCSIVSSSSTGLT